MPQCIVYFGSTEGGQRLDLLLSGRERAGLDWPRVGGGEQLSAGKSTNPEIQNFAWRVVCATMMREG
jgi:hypothetical protein